MAKVFGEIICECRRYFPADFDSDFLIGRQETFVGTYRVAFYIHIISSPLAVLIGSLLMFSVSRGNYRRLHRWIGRFQFFLILFAVAPSGLVMALQAYTGAIAASGFILHSVATAVCAIAAIRFAMKQNFAEHQRYATRCFVLLCSPLLLRLIMGASVVANTESDWTYRLTAWLSWLVPLLGLEVWYRFKSGQHRTGQLISRIPT